jgi:zinc transport system substrate-binding protein
MIVTAHAAFGYLADSYGLEQFSVAGLEPDAEPSAARIAEVQDEIRAHDVTTVYFEPLTSSEVVDAIAGDLGLDTAELDPVESVSDGEDYLTVMADNLATLRTGQGCT